MPQINQGLFISDGKGNWGLKGREGYIEPITFGGSSLGLWDNTIEGLKSAIKDLRDNLDNA